ncbi:quinol:cytochrome C oxidoreductase [Flavobacterium silvaticum]|uniref:Quinol:cytochrome C oxidoreductase n=1 Tax=Flavobacterium silvaticum TaxID=1852020 RepID=A0A972JI97_9FLAO|nr:quinol:cytochrome C oxidoreductase [Flavobacterium silvaticum]NMH27087.1 quinol:cytochrome C oxidoreductase [Flavobacterium silvaticum]
MYTLSNRLKMFSIILMVLGALGIGYGFLTAPKTIQDVEALEKAEAHHGGGHEAAGHEATPAHEAHEASAETTPAAAEAHHDEVATEEAHAEHTTAVVTDTAHAEHAAATDTLAVAHAAEVAAPAHHKVAEKHETAVDAHAEHQEHLEHVLHQLQNKPWAALYVACIFFLLITMGVLAFYGIQWVAQAGWSPVLFRVMEGITAYLPVGSVIFFIFLLICGLDLFHSNHLFPWMVEGITDPKSEHYDALVAGKSGYLNFGFWIIRAAVFLAGWNLYRFFARKTSLKQDEAPAGDNFNYKKLFKGSAGFLVFFIVSESIMSWDWIMSLDPHWFSTLFGWYVFASFFVSGITTICMVTLYLKSKGLLEYVNTSHIHDLAKFMFGISVFWTYLWFSQFMLIWYANIPEEVTYFITRINDYTVPFWGAVVMNFVFPILILVNTDFKRVTWILVIAGSIILCGHYVDFFNMIMPATVGKNWFIGISEVSSVLFFLGLFLLVIFNALTKAPLLPKGNPFIEESKHFHY